MLTERCAGCGGQVGDSIWVDDGGVFCKRCAQAKRIKYIQRNELEQDRRGAEASHGHDHVEGRQGEGR